ncbi:protein arginine kinase [Mucisphaera calidilacus]|uniref:Protein arginine kinase n=1 Tax=Mucisphaera calidilacus TaxID=2527982 RepID=A0A518BV51_9BACT|nr:protein arginine kinase [Mucisphaera calidilacus]QDU70846.1 Protein arginine kinase [Mucisphaera calidilacus]
MSLSQIPDHAGEWLRGTGPHGEVVISSRIRYARNLTGFPFVNRANRRQQHEVMHLVKDEIQKRKLADDIIWVDMAASPSLDRQLLVERHLVSRDLASAKNDAPRGVVIAPDETFAVMINEEDHIRAQVLRSGMQLSEAFAQIERIDNALESGLDFAYAQRFGYLTACPTNVGTGLRVSVMLHLPGLKLTGEIEKVRRAARDTHQAVRGLFGEGSEALGDLYQISNQSTLGKTEKEIVADFEHTVVPTIIAYEQQARQALIKQRPAQLDDKIYRAWAILTNARVLGTEEVLSLLSHLRLGVNLGRINTVDLRTINELLLLTQPAHLQRLMGKTMDPAGRKIARADLVRQRLNPAGKG